MDEFWEIAVPMLLVLASIVAAAVILIRLRNRMEPEEDESRPQIPATASRRQRKVLAQLEPDPELPTVMDLVRAEIRDLDIEEIPGHEGISGPVLLKVYKRDEPVRSRCEHQAYKYVVAAGVDRAEAQDDDVRLFCGRCGDDPEPETADDTVTTAPSDEPVISEDDPPVVE